VIAVPVFNKADYLESALDSLLSQSYENFALVVVDDASTDATPEILRRFGERDARVFLYRNPERLGMIDNKRRCFALARELFPDAAFFAWGSDHDRWRSGWLQALVDELDRNPDAVCAYPKSVRIDEHNLVISKPWSFDTRGVRRRGKRLRMSCSRLASGFMIYGLYRAAMLERVRTMRYVIEPDRLMLLELSLLGEFVQVPDILWERRFAGLSNPARQRAAFFPSGKAPWYTWLSPWVTHLGVMFWRDVVHGEGKPEYGRLRAFGLAFQFVGATVVTRVRRKLVKVKNQRKRKRRAAG